VQVAEGAADGKRAAVDPVRPGRVRVDEAQPIRLGCVLGRQAIGDDGVRAGDGGCNVGAVDDDDLGAGQARTQLARELVVVGRENDPQRGRCPEKVITCWKVGRFVNRAV
jgi:hypothetical protein